jgi:quinol monooxygenase YgiN
MILTTLTITVTEHDHYSGCVRLSPPSSARSKREVSMYGTIAQMHLKPGSLGEVTRMSETWEREHGQNTDGFVGTHIFQMDANPDEVWLVAIFENREMYQANASRPEQDEWYQQMRAHLEEDPVWHDGEIIYSGSGSKPEPAV